MWPEARSPMNLKHHQVLDMGPKRTPRSKRSRSAQSTPGSAQRARKKVLREVDGYEEEEDGMEIEEDESESSRTPRKSSASSARRTPRGAAATSSSSRSGRSGAKRRKISDEDAPSEHSSPTSRASTGSRRPSLPDIDHMTQQAAHQYFRHGANEKAWQHVELHKDLEALIENEELTPADKVYTHDLRDVEVQYRYPDNRSSSRSRSAGRSPAREVEAPRASSSSSSSGNRNVGLERRSGPDASSSSSVEYSTSGGRRAREPSRTPPRVPRERSAASGVGFVERDVVRAHLGNAPEPGASVAADVRRWNREEEEEGGSRSARRRSKSPLAHRAKGMKKAEEEAGDEIGDGEDDNNLYDGFGDDDSEPYAGDADMMGFVERDVVRAHLGNAPEPGASVAADVRRWNREEEEEGGSRSARRRSKSPLAHRAKGMKKAEEEAEEGDSSSASQKRLRYPFSILPQMWAKLVPILRALYRAMHWLLLTLPSKVQEQAHTRERIGDSVRAGADSIIGKGGKSYTLAISAIKEAREVILMRSKTFLHSGAEALDSLSVEGKRHFYASFFAGFTIFLFSMQGLLGGGGMSRGVFMPTSSPAPAAAMSPPVSAVITGLWTRSKAATPPTVIPTSLPLPEPEPESVPEPVPVAGNDDDDEDKDGEEDNDGGVLRWVLTGLLSSLYSTYDRLTSTPASTQMLHLSEHLAELRVDIGAFHKLSAQWSVLDALPVYISRVDDSIITNATSSSSGIGSSSLVDSVTAQQQQVQILARALRARLVDVALSISAPDSDIVSILLADDRAVDDVLSLKSAIRSLKAYIHQNKSLMRDLEELEQQWADLISRYRWRISADGDRNAATNPEAWDPAVIKESASGLLTDFGDKLRVLMAFKKDVPAPRVSSDAEADDGDGDGDETGRLLMKPTGYYDEQGHWWRMFNDGFDPHLGTPLTTDYLASWARNQSSVMLDEFLRERDSSKQELLGRAARELRQVAERAAVAVAPRDSVVRARRDNALGISGTPSKSLMREAPHILYSGRDKGRAASTGGGAAIGSDASAGDPEAGSLTGEGVGEAEEEAPMYLDDVSPFLSLLHHRTHHPGPLLVDHASLKRGATFLSHYSAAAAAAGMELASPSFAHAFANPFSSPVLTVPLNLKHSAKIWLASALNIPGVSSVATEMVQLGTRLGVVPTRAPVPAAPPTPVLEGMRRRSNRFGFWSIIRQMMTLLTTGEFTHQHQHQQQDRHSNSDAVLSNGDIGSHAAATADADDSGDDSYDKDGVEESLVDLLGRTIFRRSSLYTQWKPYLAAPAGNKLLALLTAVQCLLGLHHHHHYPSPADTEAEVLGYTSTAVEVPVGFSVRGSEGSVTVVFPKQQLLRSVAVQYAMQPPAEEELEGDKDGDGRGQGEELTFTCAAPTRIRLVGWLLDPRDPRYAHHTPLELGDIVIPLAALLVPSSLQGNTSLIPPLWQTEERKRGADAGAGESVEQQSISLSPTSNALLERVLHPPLSPSPAPRPSYSYFSTFVTDLPQFLRDSSGKGGDRITRPTLRAVTATIMTNSNSEESLQRRDDCTSIYRLRVMGAPEK